MAQELISIYLILSLYVIQRLSELWITQRHERYLRENHNAQEVDPKDTLRMKLFHTSWFLALFVESFFRGHIQKGPLLYICSLFLAFALFLRFYSIKKLGVFWSIKVFKMDHQAIIIDGLYRFIAHPNYLAVLVEFIFLPLLLKCYWVLVIFSLLNFWVLKRRIDLEELVLNSVSTYKEYFKMKKRFFPYFFTFFLIIASFANAETLHKKFEYKDYTEAKSAESYLKFKGDSSKLGFIHTSFDGHALRFEISYDRNADVIQKMKIQIDARSFDTDNGSRNDKMNELCLESKKYPEIIGEYNGPVDLNVGTHSITVDFMVKGKKEQLPMKLTSHKVGNSFKIKIEGAFSLKAWNIPDPSIAVASVKDQFSLVFETIL